MILEVSTQLELKYQMESTEQDLDLLSEEDCLNGIRNGLLTFKDQRIVLEERHFANRKISLVLPQSFHEVPEGLISKAGGVNQQLFGEEGFDTSFSLQKLDIPLKAAEVQGFMNEMIHYIKQMRPGFQLFAQEILQCQNVTVGCYECLLPTERGIFYHVAFICSVADQPMIGGFQFLPDTISLWQPLSKALIRTLKTNNISV
jgi:hypothetical protein